MSISKYLFVVAALLNLSAISYAATPFTTFSFSATGASSSRTDPDRWADVKNVKDFGATGNGSTDDTSNIQAAVTAAMAVNGEVFFPPTASCYKVTSSLNAIFSTSSGIKFAGAGTGSSICGTVADNAATATITLANPAVITASLSPFPANGTAIWFTTSGTLPTGISGLNNQIGYVINGNSGAGTFQIATSPGGSAVSTNGQSQSGTHTAHVAGSGYVINIQNLGTSGPYIIDSMKITNSSTAFSTGAIYAYGIIGLTVSNNYLGGCDVITFHGNGESKSYTGNTIEGTSKSTGCWGLYDTGSNTTYTGNITQGTDNVIRLNGGGFHLGGNRYETNNTCMVLGLDDSSAAGAGGLVSNLFAGGETFEACVADINAVDIAGSTFAAMTMDASSNAPSTPVVGIELQNASSTTFSDISVVQATAAYSTAAILIENLPVDVTFRNVTVNLGGQGGTAWSFSGLDARYSPYFIDTNVGFQGYKSRAYSSRPNASGGPGAQIGMVVPFTDCNNTVVSGTGWGVTITGGGGVFCYATWDGTNWTASGL